MQEMQKEYDATHKRLAEQVDILTKTNNELELKVKFMESDYWKDVEQLREKIEDLEELKQTLEGKVKTGDLNKVKMIEETEARYKN